MRPLLVILVSIDSGKGQYERPSAISQEGSRAIGLGVWLDMYHLDMADVFVPGDPIFSTPSSGLSLLDHHRRIPQHMFPFQSLIQIRGSEHFERF